MASGCEAGENDQSCDEKIVDIRQVTDRRKIGDSRFSSVTWSLSHSVINYLTKLQ